MSILIVIVGIAILILIHEFGHFLAARFFNVKVEEFGFGFPPKLFHKKIAETVYSFNLLPFGGFVRLLGENPAAAVPESEQPRSFSRQKIWKRAVIIVSGVAMNFVLGWLIVASLFYFGSSGVLAITAVVPGTPAEQADLAAGDRIVGFNRGEEFVNFVSENRGKEIGLNIRRGEKDLSVKVTPREDFPKDQGPLGIAIAEAGFPKLGFWESLWRGLVLATSIVGAIFISLINLIVSLFTGTIAFESFVGPVGIFQVAAHAGQLGFAYVLQLVALISLNLMVLNIFPFPSLDGGRLLFLAIEKLKGSPISPRRESLINAAGFMFLLLLMIAITIKDIVYLF